MQILGLIPARGGSKGVPRKNIRPFGGRPLLAWTIAAAAASRRVTRVVVSTDDAEIATIARANGAEIPFMRPADHATDTAPSIAPIQHALAWFAAHENWRPDAVALLPPTSPLRSSRDIDAAAELLENAGTMSVVSVLEMRHHPFHMFHRDGGGRLSYFIDVSPRPLRRQDLPPAFVAHQSIVMSRTEYFDRSGPGAWVADGASVAGLVVDEATIFDIDTLEDFARGEALLHQRASQIPDTA